MNEEQTRQLLRSARRPVTPTAFERTLIEEAMWSEYDRPSLLGPAELIDASTQSTGRQLRSSWHQRGVLLATVAAGLLLVGGMIRFNQRPIVDRSTATEVVQENEIRLPPERSDTVARRWGSVNVTFALPAGRTKERSTENSVLLGNRLRSAPGTMQGRILVALVEDLRIENEPVVELVEPGAVRSFSIAKGTSTVFAVADGENLVFEAGSVNEVDVYRLDGADDVIIVWSLNDSGSPRNTLILPDLRIDQ